jgi:hypothetical protein
MPNKPISLPAMALGLFALLVLASCHPSGGSGGGNPVNNSYLSSVSIISGASIITDSFSYDAQHRVARFACYATDGTNNASFTADFSFPGGATLPAGYTFVLDGGSPDQHQLTFDGQGRITKDTSLSGSHFVTYYSYVGNYVINRILFDGTTTGAQIDSLTVTDGNMTAEKIWGEDQGAWSKQADLIYGHAAAANPGYKAEVANAVGPLLYVLSVYNFGGYADYISKAIMNKISGTGDGLPAGGFNYSESIDATGRVSTQTPVGPGVPAGTKTVFTYY